MDVKDIAVSKAVQMLKAANAVYEIHYEGKVYGGLPKEELQIKRARLVTKEHHGKMTKCLKGAFENMNVGSAVTFKLADPQLAHVNINQLQSAAASLAFTLWGRDAYITHRTVDKAGVEVLRVS
jgi:hypothetical protein